MIPSLPIFADNFLLESGVQGENMTCLLKQDAWTFPFSQVTNLTLSLSPKSQISRTHNDDRVKSTFQQSKEISTHHYEIKSTHCNIVLPSKITKFKILFIFLAAKVEGDSGIPVTLGIHPKTRVKRRARLFEAWKNNDKMKGEIIPAQSLPWPNQSC